MSRFLSGGNIFSNSSLAQCSAACNNLTLGHPPEPLLISWTRIRIPSCNLLLSSFHRAEQRAAERGRPNAELLKPTAIYHNVPPPLMSAGHWCDQQPRQGSLGPRHSTFTSHTGAQQRTALYTRSLARWGQHSPVSAPKAHF